ncbi:MAG: hypothetical protein RIQ60_834 [Pseudomonadota bacterium]|jgi:DedD protein
MGLLSYFRRDAASARRSSAQGFQDSVDVIRVRARRRLVGAVVLVLAAVGGLPILLETQPRSLSADIGKNTAGSEVPLADPNPSNRVQTQAESTASAAGSSLNGSAVSKVVAAAAGAAAVTGVATSVLPSTAASAVALAPAQRASANLPVHAAASRSTVAARTAVPAARPVAEAAPKRVPDNAPRPATAPTPRQAADLRPLAKPAAPTSAKAERRTDSKANPGTPASSRFVVQVGAFEHAAAARETRSKVERLGMKAYEQEIDAGGARRIRVRLGPFASREEADRTLQKLRASGMAASVMPL